MMGMDEASGWGERGEKKNGKWAEGQIDVQRGPNARYIYNAPAQLLAGGPDSLGLQQVGC